MNGNRQMEVHYIDTDFPYTPTESFMDFFEGLTHVPLSYAHVPAHVHDQESLYWSMNMNSYKFGFSGPESSASYYGPYEVNDHLPRMDVSRRAWEYPPMMTTEEIPTSEPQLVGDTDADADADAHAEGHATPEEYTPNNEQNTNTSQVIWQDNVDPDNMTYEELLDLGEAVGTQSRGLSEELISSLPTSKFKFGSFFSRKKSGERCVVCQMRYKRGDRQIKLPCKHVYHSDCISKWLGINKICPVCNVEVFGDESRQLSSKFVEN